MTNSELKAFSKGYSQGYKEAFMNLTGKEPTTLAEQLEEMGEEGFRKCVEENNKLARKAREMMYAELNNSKTEKGEDNNGKVDI